MGPYCLSLRRLTHYFSDCPGLPKGQLLIGIAATPVMDIENGLKEGAIESPFCWAITYDGVEKILREARQHRHLDPSAFRGA